MEQRQHGSSSRCALAMPFEVRERTNRIDVDSSSPISHASNIDVNEV
jgi:hypothetical protein